MPDDYEWVIEIVRHGGGFLHLGPMSAQERLDLAGVVEPAMYAYRRLWHNDVSRRGRWALWLHTMLGEGGGKLVFASMTPPDFVRIKQLCDAVWNTERHRV